jgi:hypothetical protein
MSEKSHYGHWDEERFNQLHRDRRTEEVVALIRGVALEVREPLVKACERVLEGVLIQPSVVRSLIRSEG